MPREKLLLIGAGGNIGYRIALKLADRYDLIPAVGSHTPGGLTGAVRLDVTRRQEVLDFIAGHRPDAVVNLAALADADRCEVDPAIARRINIEGAGNVASACRKLGCYHLYYSTDLVFDGSRGSYTETDEARPISVYGNTKLDAEGFVSFLCPGGAVVRTAIVFGPGSGNRPSFFERTVAAARSGARARLFTDQYRSFLFVDDSAEVVDRLVRQRTAGLYHAGGSERLSRYDFTRRALTGMGLPADGLEPVSMADIPTTAHRPADCSLDSGKLMAATGWSPTPLD